MSDILAERLMIALAHEARDLVAAGYGNPMPGDISGLADALCLLSSKEFHNRYLCGVLHFGRDAKGDIHDFSLAGAMACLDSFGDWLPSIEGRQPR